MGKDFWFIVAIGAVVAIIWGTVGLVSGRADRGSGRT